MEIYHKMKKIYILAAAALALASCDNNIDNPDNSSEPIKVYASIGDAAISRAADTSWADGDEIGIYLQQSEPSEVLMSI